jgi:hypothetical protein
MPCDDESWPTLLHRAGPGTPQPPLPDCTQAPCECGPSEGAACPASLKPNLFFGTGCTAANGYVAVTVTPQCTQLNTAGGDSYGSFSFEPLAATGGSCEQETITSSPVLASVQWEDPVAVCTGLDVGGGCESNQACAGTDEPPCIGKEGDQSACPGGMIKTLLYYVDSDSRACECSCSPDAYCESFVHLYQSYDGGACDGLLVGGDPGCTTIPAGTIQAAQAFISPPRCINAQVESAGEVIFAPYTVCCPP